MPVPPPTRTSTSCSEIGAHEAVRSSFDDSRSRNASRINVRTEPRFAMDKLLFTERDACGELRCHRARLGSAGLLPGWREGTVRGVRCPWMHPRPTMRTGGSPRTSTSIVIRGYYFPMGRAKVVSYDQIRGVAELSLGRLSGKGRIWGTARPACVGESRSASSSQEHRVRSRHRQVCPTIRHTRRSCGVPTGARAPWSFHHAGRFGAHLSRNVPHGPVPGARRRVPLPGG